MVKANSDVDTTIKDFVRVLADKIEVQAVFAWTGSESEGYPGIALIVISPHFGPYTEERDAFAQDKVLVDAIVNVDDAISAWGFSPGQLAHDPYSPLLEMMLQDARQVYPPLDAPAQPRARKAKAGHVN